MAMGPIVLDASAVRAIFQQEHWWQKIADRLLGSKIPAVKWSEALQKNRARGVSLLEQDMGNSYGPLR